MSFRSSVAGRCMSLMQRFETTFCPTSIVANPNLIYSICITNPRKNHFSDSGPKMQLIIFEVISRIGMKPSGHADSIGNSAKPCFIVMRIAYPKYTPAHDRIYRFT